MDASVSTLVIPCYNEETRFRADSFAAFLDQDLSVRFLFVNDGSCDNTLARLRSFAAEFPNRTEVLDVQPNGGKGEAVRRGMLHALRSGCAGNAVGFWDADLATPLEAVPDFLRILSARPEIDAVFGSRVSLLGRNVVRNPARHYAGRIFATSVSLRLRLPIYDSQCGAKFFRATPLLDRVLLQPFQSRWIFDVEILARFLRVWRAQGIAPETKIYEMPLTTWIDVPGSKVEPIDFLRSFFDLMKIDRN